MTRNGVQEFLLLDVTLLVLETAGGMTTKLLEQCNVHDFVFARVSTRITIVRMIHDFEKATTDPSIPTERNTVICTKKE